MFTLWMEGFAIGWCLMCVLCAYAQRKNFPIPLTGGWIGLVLAALGNITFVMARL